MVRYGSLQKLHGEIAADKENIILIFVNQIQYLHGYIMKMVKIMTRLIISRRPFIIIL